MPELDNGGMDERPADEHSTLPDPPEPSPMSGIVVRRLPVGPARLPGAGGGTTPWRSGFPLALRRFEGWTRGGSPACLAKWGGHGASPNPASSC